MKRTWIVTGAAGHLGGAILRQLQGTDCAVRGLVLPGEKAAVDGQAVYCTGDVRDPDSLEPLFAGAEGEVTVLHTAGIISINDTMTDALYAVNVEGTRHVICQCLRHGVRRLVYVSSVHAIPEQPDGRVVREVSAFSRDAVVGAYAATKAEATQAVLDAGKEGLDVVVVHPSGIIGPYDDGRNHTVQLLKMCLDGRLPAVVKGGYDFVDVRDVARGCLLAAEKGRAGECYILSGRYCTIQELAEMVRALAGGRKKLCLPLGAAYAALPFFGLMAKVSRTRPLFTKYALYTISGNARFSCEKAAAELGYCPRDLRLTVRDTVAWLQGRPVACG